MVDPESGFLVTANNRIVGDDYPHHITSDWLDGFRAARIEQLLRRDRRARPRRLRGDAVRHPLDARAARRRAGWRGCSRPASASAARSSGCAAGTGGSTPRPIAGTIYQAFLLRLAREFARAAIGDRDLSERWLDRADNGFIAARHLALALALAPDGALGGGRRGADRPALGRAGAGGAARRPRRPRATASAPTPRAGAGATSTRWSSRTRSATANPLLRRLLNRRLQAGGAQETVSQIAYDPNDPYKAVWAPSWRMVADPTAPERSRWQMFTGQSGPPRQPPLRRPPGRLARGPHPADGRRGPLETLRPEPVAAECPPAATRSSSARTSSAELIDGERVAVVSTIGPRGWPHSMPLWYVPRDGEIWIWTYAKSQKVQQPRARPARDAADRDRASSTASCAECRSRPRRSCIRDIDRDRRLRQGAHRALREGIESVEGDAAAALEAQAPKRVAIHFHPKRSRPGTTASSAAPTSGHAQGSREQSGRRWTRSCISP